jgi:hypothetical protein
MPTQELLTSKQIETAKLEDVTVIRDILTERREPLTLENARFVLVIGLKNRPDAWTITLAELPELWAEQVTT